MITQFEDYCLWMYVVVAELWPQVAPRCRRPGPAPECSDSELVTMAEALLGEDPHVVTAGLVHELRHASDIDLIDVGLLSPDCVELEARAFEAQAIATRGLWPDELPS